MPKFKVVYKGLDEPDIIEAGSVSQADDQYVFFDESGNLCAMITKANAWKVVRLSN
jgi:hypothetical protein